MFWKKNNKKYEILFIVSSLIAFVFFVIIMISYSYYFKYTTGGLGDLSVAETDKLNASFYLKESDRPQDPYITKVPALKDMIRGPIITDLDPSLGDMQSDVTVVLFSDFECEYCAKLEQVLQGAFEKYKIRLVWKDYPSNYPKSSSFQAAIAARCAERENAFWEYHNMLFSGSFDLTRENFIKIADKLYMDTVDFTTCLDNLAPAQLVQDNMAEAEALGINGVPFLYVNDQEMLGDITKEDLARVIEVEMGKKK